MIWGLRQFRGASDKAADLHREFNVTGKVQGVGGNPSETVLTAPSGIEASRSFYSNRLLTIAMIFEAFRT